MVADIIIRHPIFCVFYSYTGHCFSDNHTAKLFQILYTSTHRRFKSHIKTG